MLVRHLNLSNFRSYVRLELDLPDGISVLQGANAQGKTNLLEAISFLATHRSSRAVSERELINWAAMNEPMPLASLSATVDGAAGNLQLRVVLRPRLADRHQNEATAAPIQKYVQVNGVARRVVDAVGYLNTVIFSPSDLDIVGGEPALRRRYLDAVNSQVNPQYLRALQRYSKVVARRNHLLRQLAAHQARPDELGFWDKEMVACGARVIADRLRSVVQLSELARPIHSRLSGGEESLSLIYRTTIGEMADDPANPQALELAFREALTRARDREMARGVSLVGPHRDDLAFMVNETNMGIYGSRGQRRTIALSIRLAEAEFLLAKAGDPPVLLLDDVLSELDEARRHHVLEAITGYQQVIITTADSDRFPPGFLARATEFRVEAGEICRAPTRA